jgi:four helix bundle protein
MKPDTNPTFPHHRLAAWHAALELARMVHVLAANIPRGDRSLADQMLRSSQSCVLLVAEGANRMSTGEKRQRYSLARGECGECAAALELVSTLGLVDRSEVGKALVHAGQVAAMLTGLVRRFSS